jgi:hypothetical protein
MIGGEDSSLGSYEMYYPSGIDELFEMVKRNN